MPPNAVRGKEQLVLCARREGEGLRACWLEWSLLLRADIEPSQGRKCGLATEDNLYSMYSDGMDHILYIYIEFSTDYKRHGFYKDGDRVDRRETPMSCLDRELSAKRLPFKLQHTHALSR